ncbi:ABC transporter substrate-binding protein [Paenibacillus sp. NPDC058071]|uniref:ABC transporter substrate-binding protein n=1 Tax=Paenibacillus sp. NPDC058071 TaxID=3346326 RepID=UPI0036DBF7A0
MKKIGFILTLSIVLLLSACSGNSAGTGNNVGNGGGDSKGETKADKKTVVLSVMRKDRFLENAARQFEEKHQDIHIEIKEYKASPEAPEGGMGVEAISLADVEKYVQSVTTQVISGKGADLILMNELPQDKFVAKKLLVNLNELMDKDKENAIDRNALYDNILKSSKDGKGLYVMPLSFSLDLVRGNTELLKEANVPVDKQKPWSWAEFKEVAKKLKQQGYEGFGNLSSTQLVFDYIEDNYAQLAGQGKPNFDSELFRGMMQEIKSMYDEGLLIDGMAGFSSDFSKTAFQMAGIYSTEELMMMPSNMEYYQKPSAGGNKNGVPFKFIYSLGINSKSDVQPEAWAFIKYLLSDEMQASPELMGLPMNKGVADQKFKEALQKLENGELDQTIPKSIQPDVETAKKRIADVQKLISEADFQRFSDMKVLMIAMEEFNSFMNGQKSAEEVSKLIQNRANTYLNE